MKKLFLLLTIISLTLTAVAQVDESVATDYKSQYSRLYKSYLKDTADVANLLALADFYSKRDNPLWDLPTSMYYLLRAESIYIDMVKDDSKYRKVSRLVKKKITVNSIREKKAQTVNDALNYVSGNEYISSENLNNLAMAFKSNRAILQHIETRRMQQAFTNAKKTNALTAYNEILKKYNGTETAQAAHREMLHVADSLCGKAHTHAEIDALTAMYLDVPGIANIASRRKATLDYPRVAKENTLKGYREFLSLYPDCDEYVEVLDKIDSLVADEYASMKTPQQYADFVKNNRENTLAEQALATLRYKIRNEHDAVAAKVYLANFPLDAEYNEIYRIFYSWHTAEGNADPILRFKKQHPSFPFMDAVNADLTAAQRHDKINFMQPYQEHEYSLYAGYARRLTGKRLALVALQRTLQQQIARHDWSGAAVRVSSFDEITLDACMPEAKEIETILTAPTDSRKLATSVLPSSSNAYNAVLYPGNEYLYFTRVADNDTSIRIARRDNSKWKILGGTRFANMPNSGLTVYGFFDHGRKMLLGKNGDICVAELNDTAWMVTEILPYPINTDYFDGDASMLPDGSGMLLVSDRPEGHNLQQSHAYFHGDTAMATDIYFIPRTAHGWGTPVNLGSTINSAYCERSPVMSRDLKTLYFTTDARGLGYSDVYEATRSNMNGWTEWTTPQNFGKEVNTGFNESSVTLADDGGTLLVCSNGQGQRYGCSSVTLSSQTVTPGFREVLISSPKVESLVRIYEWQTQQLVAEQTITPQSPMTLSLQSSKRYVALSSANPNYLTASVIFTPSGKNITFRSNSTSELLQSGEWTALPAVRFEPNGSTLLTTGELELDNLAFFLVSNPGCQVEIRVHAAGNDDAKCFNISKQRGQTIKKYLQNNGVSAYQIVVSNYGNSVVHRDATMPEVLVSFSY